GSTVDYRNIEGDMALTFIGKVQQFMGDLCIIEVIEAVALPFRGVLGGTGSWGDVIITAEVIFLEYLKNQLTAGAAEVFIVKMKNLLPTSFPTVIASSCFMIG